MKQVLKLIGGLLFGAAVGFIIATIGVVLFTELTLAEFFAKFSVIEIMDIMEGALAGGLGIIVAIVLQTLIHEAGHLMCGLLSGYTFVSFRLFSLILFRNAEGKLRLKRFSIAGTGGQCLLLPPDVPYEQMPTFWYNAGGVLFNLIAVLLAIPLFFLEIHPFCFVMNFMFVFAGGFIILTNGIPMTIGGINNDGKNALQLHKNKADLRALDIQLRSNALVQQGVRPKDLPAEWFETAEEIDYKDSLQVAVAIFSASYFLDRMEWEKAYQTLTNLNAHKAEIMPLFVNEIACELLFAALITGRNDEAAQLYTDELKKYIRQTRAVMSSKERVLCAIALKLEQDPEKAREIYEKVLANRDKYLMQGEVESDLALMQEICLGQSEK